MSEVQCEDVGHERRPGLCNGRNWKAAFNLAWSGEALRLAGRILRSHNINSTIFDSAVNALLSGAGLTSNATSIAV